MGVSFIIEPLTPEARKRLTSAKSKGPKALPESRGPTRKELRSVLDGLRGYRVAYRPARPQTGGDWWIDVTSRRQSKSGPFASVHVRNLPTAAEPLPYISIDRGSPEAVAAIVTGLASITGPLLLDGEDVYGRFVVDGRWSAAQLAAAMEGRAMDRGGER